MYFPSTTQLKSRFGTAPSSFWISSSQENGKKTKEKPVESVKEEAAHLLKPEHYIEVCSLEYFKCCSIGGIFACGPPHAAVCPLDVVKVRAQNGLYKSQAEGLRSILKNEGPGGLLTGFGATLVGYGFQGSVIFGLYEYFKYKYAQLTGGNTAEKWRTPIYLIASASAEFFGDIVLCPWEAIKVRAQSTIPPVNTGLIASTRVALGELGIKGLYNGLVPLWFRQVPYTMVKFATFEDTVEAIYAKLPRKKEEYSTLTQTGISCLGGYIAGIFCTVVSHPADTLVSKINEERLPQETVRDATSRIYREIGFNGLWTGITARILMIGTLTALQWMTYDSFKAYVGLPTSG